MKTIQIKARKEKKLLNYALGLAIFTVLYNLAEGIVSIYFGVKGGKELFAKVKGIHACSCGVSK